MVDELCRRRVKKLREEVNRHQSIRASEQERDRSFSEMLQSQDFRESRTSVVMEKQVDSEPCSQRTVAQWSVKDEGLERVTARTRRKAPPSSQNLTGMAGTFYNRYEALELEGQTTNEVGKGTSGIVGPPKTTPPVPHIKIFSVKGKRRIVVIGDSLQRGMKVKFKISVYKRERARKTSTPDMSKTEFRLLRELVSKVPQKNVPADAMVPQCWSLFEHHSLRAQEQTIPKCQKTSRRGRRPAWLEQGSSLGNKAKNGRYMPSGSKVN